jgi:hypothetical protein
MQLRDAVRLAAVAFSVSGLLFGQAGLGSINGTVVDPSGAVVPAATIRLIATATQGVRVISTNEAGLFTLPSVVPDQYKIVISATGFREKTLESIVVNGFQQVSLGQVTLDVGQGATTVTVTAEQQMIKESAVRYDSIQARQVSEMPLMGRNWTGLLKAIPGANATSSAGFNGREYGYYGYADFQVNGKASTQTAVNLDGGGIVDHGSDGKTTVAPSLESIQELAMLTNNFQAEYGTRSGVVINVVTKSGTNEYRGTVWNYLRNEALNANTWQNNFTGARRNKYRYDYFGGNLGGPVVKNKVFFFYNYEYFKQNTPGATSFSRVPTALERQGDFSQTVNSNGQRPVIYQPGSQFSGTPVPFPNNTIPASTLNPLGKALMSIYPLPNYPGDLSVNYTYTSLREAPRYSHVAKGDWNISDRARAYYRFTRDNGTARDLGTWNSSAPFAFNQVRQPRPDTAWAGNLTYTFTPTVVMESVVAWSKDDVKVYLDDEQAATKAKYGLSKLPTAFAVPDDILPQVTTGIYPDYHFNRLPSYSLAWETQASTTVSWTRGTHFFKFGGQFIRNDKYETQATANKGAYDFRASQSPFDTNYAPSNMLLGALASFQQIDNVNSINTRVNQYLFFAQDTWKVRPGLTFDYGMRFYHLPAEFERTPDKTRDAVFLPSKWDPAKAPRFYIPDPKNPNLVIDPANPGSPLAAAVANNLRYTIVPGSGDLMNGVFSLGQGGLGNAPLKSPAPLLMAPRAGFAWSPGNNTRTVIRGGFGWTYNFLTLGISISPFRNGLANQVNIVQTSLDTMVQNSSTRRIDARAYSARDESDVKMPRVYDFSLGIQRELPLKLVFEIGYVGNLQRHQPVTFELNAVPFGTAWQAKYVDPRSTGYNFSGPVTAANPGALPGSNTQDAVVMRPYQGLGAISGQPFVANNRYDSLQSTVNRRFSGGLTMSAAYTWGRLKTQTESRGPYFYNWKDYAGYKSTTDRRHVATVNYTYEFPKFASKLGWNNAFSQRLLNDWQIAHMATFFSGQDYTPGYSLQQASTTTGIDMSRIFLGTNDVSTRLLLNGDPNAVSRDMAHQFDPTKVAIPTLGGTGNGPLNYIQGRGSFSNDINLSKVIRIRERMGLELRASFFNAFNQVRRLGVNTGIQYKAQGKNFSDGVKIINTPEYNAAATTGDNLKIWNAYRAGVGHVNVTGVEPMRIVEIGMKLKF